jgi:pyruvate carboxylase
MFPALLTRNNAAMKIGVPVVPGTPGPVGDYTEAHSFIEEYGFPGEFICRIVILLEFQPEVVN